MRDKSYHSDLVKHFDELLIDEIVEYIKSLRINEKLGWDGLYLKIIEKYPQLKVDIIGVKYTRRKREESKALYVAAFNYYQNRTPSYAWERW
jgi:hypothetical protein